MPVAVYCVVCDDARPDPVNPIRVDLIGLLAQVRSYASPPFPILRPQFSVFLMLAEPDPIMSLTVQVVRSDTGDVIRRTRTYTCSFPGGPSQLSGVTFKIQNVRFPVAGLYWVECWSAGTRLARQRLYATA